MNTTIDIETTGVFPSEMKEQTVLDALCGFVDHLDENRFDVIDGMVLTLRDSAGKFQARFSVRVTGSHRRVELLDYTDIH